MAEDKEQWLILGDGERGEGNNQRLMLLQALLRRVMSWGTSGGFQFEIDSSRKEGMQKKKPEKKKLSSEVKEIKPKEYKCGL